MTDHSIKGKTVLIAGGAKNLGGLIARDLAEQGAKAIAVHYNSAAPPSRHADETVAADQGAPAPRLSPSRPTSPRQVRWRSSSPMPSAAMGSIDIAINTVGKVLKKPMVEISEAEYDEMTAVNSKTAFFFLKEAGKQRQRQRQGRDAGHLAARRVHALLCGLCRHQGAGRAFHAGGIEGVRRARHLGDGDRAGPDGHAVLLSGRGRRRGRLSQDGGGAVQASPRPA